jgi:hypothetical protein
MGVVAGAVTKRLISVPSRRVTWRSSNDGHINLHEFGQIAHSHLALLPYFGKPPCEQHHALTCMALELPILGHDINRQLAAACTRVLSQVLQYDRQLHRQRPQTIAAATWVWASSSMKTNPSMQMSRNLWVPL